MSSSHALLRGRAFEGQKRQAVKMREQFGKAAAKKVCGDCVSVPLSSTRGITKFDGKNIIGVVVDVNDDGCLRIAVQHGVLQRWYHPGNVHLLKGTYVYACHLFTTLTMFHILWYLGFSNNVLIHALKAAQDGWRELPSISEKAAIEARRMPGVTAFTRCTCKGKCDTKSSSCFRKGRTLYLYVPMP
jgi:hypothetical protein